MLLWGQGLPDSSRRRTLPPIRPKVSQTTGRWGGLSVSLVISLGSNLGDRQSNIAEALERLGQRFRTIEASRLYRCAAVDYEDQPEFLNAVAEYESPRLSPEEVLQVLLGIEKEMGRTRSVPKGPRTIDLDILFFDDIEVDGGLLTIPHPRLFDRSFVIRPLAELPSFKRLDRKYTFKNSFKIDAFPYTGKKD